MEPLCAVPFPDLRRFCAVASGQVSGDPEQVQAIVENIHRIHCERPSSCLPGQTPQNERIVQRRLRREVRARMGYGSIIGAILIGWKVLSLIADLVAMYRRWFCGQTKEGGVSCRSISNR